MLDSDCDPWSEELLLETVSADLVFGLYSVITTVILLTVTSRVWAVLRSTFFNRGRWRRFFSAFLSFRSFFVLLLLLVAGRNWLATCWATNCGLIRGFLVEVPLRTSHIKHLNASAVFLNVHTLQSQKFSSITLGPRFARRMGLFLLSILAPNNTKPIISCHTDINSRHVKPCFNFTSIVLLFVVEFCRAAPPSNEV